MNNSIKLLALDIDGTLMGKDYILKQPIIDAVKRVINKTNVKVVLASGRMTFSTKPVAEQLGIKTPAVIYQGAMVKDLFTGEILFHKDVLPEYALQVIEDIEKENIHVNLYIEDKLYMKQLSDIAKIYSSYRYVEPHLIDDYNILNNNPPTKILGLNYDLELINRVKASLKEKYKGKLNIFSSCPMFIEVVNKDVNKGQTLFNMAKKLWNIDPENIMAIGDGDNDFEMIQKSGFGIAMDNASDKTKSGAIFVTSSVDDHGAAKAIDKYIFNGDLI